MKKFAGVIVSVLLSAATVCAQHWDTLGLKPKEHKFRFSTVIAPAGLMVAGVLTNSNHPEGLKMELREERNENLPGFHTKVDNYLRLSPYFIAYGLDAIGVQSRTNIIDRTVILAKGQILMLASVALIKQGTHQLRPDGTTYNSFPSGHTAQAFAAATLLSEEYKKKLPWMPYAAYTLAGSVGALRIANNRHYVSDVLFGAGLGILSMKVAYWTHQYRWGQKKYHAPVSL